MPEQLWEQQATFPVSSPTVQRRRQVITDDAALLDDDVLYETRSPTSVRRYHVPTHTEIRVTRHQGIPPRASHKQQQQPLQPQARPRRRIHWLFFVGVGASAMMVLYLVANLVILPQWDRMQDNAHYGYPRTFQCDAYVKHNGVSHFVVQNLHGHVFVIEIPESNLSQTKIYTGPVLAGADADLVPATVTFQDVNGDGLPDMILKMAGTAQVTVYINTGQGFRPMTANDHIKLEGGQQ